MDLRTRWTADELEARDTSVDPLAFLIIPDAEVGDNVTLLSSDGWLFIGHIADQDESGVWFVELD